VESGTICSEMTGTIWPK